MEALEARIADNIWDGQVYEIDYRATDQLPRDVAGVGAFADSALWTGTYLGSQSFRYAVAKRKLADATLPLDQRDIWLDHKAEAKSRIDDMLRKFHMLVNISREWNHELELNPQQTGFGGGIISGEPGYLMRACIDRATIDANPTSDPEDGGDETKPDFYGWSSQELDPELRDDGLGAPYTSKRRVFGPFTWEGKEYFCEDGTSRDAYAGTIFGLLVAFDLYSRDNPAMRTQIRDDVVTLSNFALKYLWTTPRPHGQISIPIDSNHDEEPCSQINELLDICGHDFENFWSPLFAYTPTAQMELTQAARHVLNNAPGRFLETQKWNAVFAAEIAATGPFMSVSHLFDSAQPYDSYYKWNLEHLIAYNLIRQAPGLYSRTMYKEATAVMDATTGDDVNAHFEAIMYGVTGDRSRLLEAVQYLREWKLYRHHIDKGADGDFFGAKDGGPDGVPDVDNLRFCGTSPESLDCVPEDQLDVEPVRGEGRYVIPGSSGSLRAHEPLPVARRTPTDFLWQRPPNQLRGSEERRHQAPGIDYLLPYWMIRYLTEVPGSLAGASPITPWLGPSFH